MHTGGPSAGDPVAVIGELLLGEHGMTFTLSRRPETGAWVADLGCYDAIMLPAQVRVFAEAIRSVLDGAGELYCQLFDDGYAVAEATLDLDADDPVLLVWVYFNVEQDFVGLDADGGGVYSNRFGAANLELLGENIDRDQLAVAGDALLSALNREGEAPATNRYYARLAAGRSRKDPSGVLRRQVDGDTRVDEVFTRNFRWEPTDYFDRYRLGHNDVEHVEIGEAEVERFINRLTARRR